MGFRLFMALILGWALPVQAMNIQLSHSDDEELDTADLSPNHRFLFAEGVIAPGDADAMKALLNEQYANKKRTVILLTSNGGVLEEVENLKSEILKAAKSYFARYGQRLILIVNLECSSACNILLAGLTQGAAAANLEIHIANTAKFGFHSPVDIVKNKVTPIKSKKKLSGKLAKMLKAYQDYGVSPAWLKAQRALFQSPKMTRLAADKLCAAKSGIIPEGSCFEAPADRDLFSAVSETLQQNKPLFSKTK